MAQRQNREARAVGRTRARADQAVLGVVEGAVRLGEVAVGIVSEASASRRGILVEAVAGVGPVDVIVPTLPTVSQLVHCHRNSGHGAGRGAARATVRDGR